MVDSALTSEGTAPGARRRRWAPLAVLAIVVIAFGLRVVAIGHPAAGYHVFNEGFYTMLSAEALEQGPFAWLTEPGDLNNPPLYPLIVTTLFRFLGVSVVVARLVSALAGAVTVLYVYLLGRELVSERAGLIGAALLAAMPGAVLITHNAQTDGLMVLLVVAATYYYVRGRARGDRWLPFVGGLLLGLGVAAKLPAVLALPALALWATLATPGLGWLKERRVWTALGGFALTGLPWHVAQLALNGPAYLAAQSGIGSSFALPDARFWSVLLYDELRWMHWPPVFVLAAAGVAYALWRRTDADLLALVFVGVNLAFYAFYHFHTYYLLPVAPFSALLAAGVIEALAERWRAVVWPVTGALVAGLVVASLVMLGGHKIGAFSPASIEPAIGPDAMGADLWVDYRIWANYGPAVDLYVPNMTVRAVPEENLDPGPENLTPGVRSFLLTPAVADIGEVAELHEHRHALVLFGIRISEWPEQDHYLANGPWQVRWGAYPPLTFGLRPIEPPQPGPHLYDLDVVYGTGGAR
jgi:4-amino-4-deoxy-L-arabinose transferase-like glycosyltransferase